MTLKSALLYASALAGASFSQEVYAQTAGAPTPNVSAGVQEVVVTAQRRAENLQQVPLSVEAITGATLRNEDVNDIDRLEQIAPGVRIGRSGDDVRPAIRGVYTEAVQGNSDPRIGYYIDEIYQSRTAQASAPLVDLERVEVQKGPQGTLYGRNTFGGNIAVTSAVPKDKEEGDIELTYGNYNRVLLDGYFNTPIAPGLDLRLAGNYERHDCYIEDVTKSNSCLDDQNQYYGRASLRWVPPSMGGKLEVLVHASYWNQRDNGDGTFGAKTIGALVDPALITAPGGTLNAGNGTFQLQSGYNGATYSGQLYPYVTAYRDGVPDLNGADIGIPILGKYKITSDYHPFNRVQETELSSTINYDFLPMVRLRSISGYVNYNAIRSSDNDGTSAPYSFGYDLTKDLAFSQEFQVLSNDKSSPFQYVVGGYFLYDQVPDAYLGAYNHGYSAANQIADGGLVLYSNNYSYSPLQTGGVPTTANQVARGGSDYFSPLQEQTTQSYASYAQVSYTLFDKLTFTGGVRYTIDHKDYKTAVSNLGVPAGSPAGSYLTYLPSTSFNTTCNGFTSSSSNDGGVVQPDALVTRCGEKTTPFATYHAAVDYKFDLDHMVYASFSTGEHSGGFGTSPISNGTGIPILSQYEAEKVQAYEVGSKNQFFEHRLQVNVDAFYNSYTHLQVQGNYANPFIPNSVISYLTNGPSDHAPGVDVEIIAKPIRPLTINFSVNYLHARDNSYPSPAYTSPICSLETVKNNTCLLTPQVAQGYNGGFLPNVISNPNLFVPLVNAAGQQVYVGGVPQYNSLEYGHKNRVQLTPDWSLQGGASYAYELGGGARITPEFQTYFNGGYLLSAALPNFEQSAYIKTDMRVTYFAADGRTSVQAYVENLEDVAVINRVTTSGNAVAGNYADPRTFGIKLGYRF